jgi:hypothetical protein
MNKANPRKGFFFFLFCMIFGSAVSFGGFAWTVDEVKGFNKAVFDYHFSRADREPGPEGWMTEARRGIGLAMSAWEEIAPDLYPDILLMKEAEDELRRWSEDELEARFTRWLFRRFFGDGAEGALEGLSLATDASHLRYTYHLDAEGKLLRDEETGDPEIIRPGETDLSGDREYWKQEAKEGLLNGEARYGAILSASFPELLAWIAPERRDGFEEKLRDAGNMAGISLRGEFENLVAREERLFVARRTGDVYSLRRKSDDEAASAITSRLISEAEAVCAEGIASLTARIEDAAAGTGDLALAGNEWLEEYREQFNRGLKAWEEAEERFFARRIEWEQDAGLRYVEGEDSWIRAFERFEEERRKWELNVKFLLESGEKLFLDASENLERVITEAREEFEKDVLLRTTAGALEAEAWVDLYLAAGSMAAKARENIRYWLQFYGGAGAPDISDSRFEAWVEGELGKETNSGGEYRAMLEEIKEWSRLYRTCTARTVEARDALTGQFGLVMGEGALTDILAGGAESSGFYLDEYQIELVRAKALAGYWARRLAIAEAVSAYAAELTAGRMTDAEGLAAWEESKRAYDGALEICGAALARLNQAGADLAEAQAALTEAAAALREADEKLVELDNEYSSMMTVYVSERNDFILEELNVKYRALLEEYRALNKSGADAVYFRYLQSSVTLADARRQELTGEKLKALILGINGEASLAALREAAERAKVFNEEDVLPGTMEGYGLAEDNPYYALIANLLPEKALYHDLVVSLCGAAKSSLQAELDLRLQGLRLFCAGSSAEWFAGTGLHTAGEDITGLVPADLMLRLSETAGASYLTLLEARIDLETEGLEAFLGGTGTAGRAGLLATLCLTDRTGTESALVLLEGLKEKIGGEGQITTAEEEWFVSGGSFFMAAEGYLRRELDDFRWKSGLLELYRMYGNGIDYAERETWNHTLGQLDGFFAAHGVETEGALFPDTESLKNAILAKGGDPLFHTAEFIDGLNRQFYFLPSWLAGVLGEWESAFAACMYALTEGRNEGGGETHWREYLGKYIREDDAEVRGIPAASGRAEGNIRDAEDSADRQLNMLRDAMALYGEYVAVVRGVGDSPVRDYFDNPAAPWDESILCPADPLLGDIHNEEEAEYRIRLMGEKTLQSDIVRLGKIYDLSGSGLTAINEAMERQLKKIGEQKAAVEAAKRGYELAADRFYEGGMAYDNRYVLLKEAREHQEEKRFEYEKQDAIRRWASTAYLDGNSDEEEICRSNLERAETVLLALENLYNGGEERRPYADEEYARLYREYGESAGRIASVIGASDLLDRAVLKAEETSLRLYGAFSQSLSLMQGNIRYDEGYTSPDSRADWGIRDIIGINDRGMLCFSFDGINENSLRILNGYLEKNGIDGQGSYELSRFDEAVLALNQRMASYITTREEYEQWGLARDYLIRNLLQANGNIPYLKENYRTADAMKPGTPLGEMEYYKDLFEEIEIWEADRNAVNYINTLQYSAYTNMSDAKKADLEFFTILDLLGGGGENMSSFMTASLLKEYKYVLVLVGGKYAEFERKCDDWWEPAFLYRGHRDRAKNAFLRIWPMYVEVRSRFASGQVNLLDSISRLEKNNRDYLDSCVELAVLRGEKGTAAVEWDDIEKALGAAGVSDGRIIGDVKTSWNMMMSKGNAVFYSVSEAMTGLMDWSAGVRDDRKQALEEKWQKDEFARVQNLSGFRVIADAFIAGEADLWELSESMEEAFGENAPSLKNHLENMERVLGKGLDSITMEGNGGRETGAVMAKEYAELVIRSIRQRSRAELAAREEEWNIERNDINEKYFTWKNTAAQILERGRTDWKNSTERMRNAFSQWISQFNEEYKRMDETWNAAFLAALEDKEAWLDRAAAAAAAASSGAMLALVGADAEAGARAMDTRVPVGMTPVSRTGEAEKLLEELLGASGIRNMADAFGGIGSAAETAGSFVRRGIGGQGFWNAGTAKVATANLIRESNAKLAARESRRLAIVARTAARDAIASLETVVDGENKNFRAAMDEIFIFDGQWRRNGNNYIKEIVVHATLFDPVITEPKEVTGYRNYQLQMPEFRTNLDDSFLEKLDVFAIQALIQNIYREVEDVQKDVFGAADEKTEVKVYHETRFLEPGKFGLHIGYMPVQNPSPNLDSGRSGIILHSGAGELGRMMSDYYYWAVIDSNGLARSSMAPWDRPLWDSRGSWFEAPTVRSISEIALQTITAAVAVVAAAAAPFTGGMSTAAAAGMMAAVATVETAVNLVDDAVFFALDTGFGYKRFDEAGFEFGKKALVTASSSMLGAIFGGAGNLQGLTGVLAGEAGSRIGKTAVKTIMTGTQTMLNGIAANALNGIQYSHEGGWSYSGETFANGLAGMGANVLSSLASALTGEVMNWGLEGFYGDVYSNGARLSALTGGLAGQGVNYAFGNGFTLNLANSGLLTHWLLSGGGYLEPGPDLAGGGLLSHGAGTGFLELRLDNGGAQMGFGSNGLDVSISTLAAASKGFEAWRENTRLLLANDVTRKYASQMRTLYSGNETNREEYESYIAGTTVARERYEVAGTESVFDKAAGIKYVYLGEEALNDASRFGLNIYFSHESYRNGMDDGELGQMIETNNAVTGHIAAAMGIMGTYGENSITSALAQEARTFYDNIALAMTAGNSEAANNARNRIGAILGKYDSSGDFWRLKYDTNGNGFLEYDGLADIYDADGNFLIGAGTAPRALQTALAKYLGVSMSDAGKIMSDAGFKENGNSWVNNENINKRISIGRATDSNITDYIFAAHYSNFVRGAISSVLFTENNIVSAREILLAETNGAANIASRYSILKRAMIDFYLPAASMFGGVESILTTDAGNPSDYPDNLHKGNDYAAARGTVFNTIFSGIVKEISEPQSIFFNDEEAFNASRNLYTPSDNHKWYYTHHDERYDENGARVYVQDQNLRGNGVIIDHGFYLNGNFLSMGFTTRSNHFDSVSVSVGQYLQAGTGIGTTGNSGWSTGPHVDYNLYYRANTTNLIKNIYNLGNVIDNWDGGAYVNPLNIYRYFK